VESDPRRKVDVKETTSSHVFESSKTNRDGSQITVFTEVKKVEKTTEERYEKPGTFKVEITSERITKAPVAKQVKKK
jgi:hypothetical protein